MNFIENIFQRLAKHPERPVLREIRDGQFIALKAGELLAQVRAARTYIRQSGMRRGARCGLLAPNSMRWVAVDLALMAEGIIVVPLYPRQAPHELAGMLKDCGAEMAFCSDESLREGLAKSWSGGPSAVKLFDEILAMSPAAEIPDQPIRLVESDTVTIIYTSGTSGEPKGVMLTAGNVTHMLTCTNGRLDQLMEGASEKTPDQVFHYLPFCFAGSWVLLLSALARHCLLTLSTDLTRLADELKLASPQYCLNVPTLLERIRTGVEAQISHKPAMIRKIYYNGKAAWMRQYEGRATGLDRFWLALAKTLLYAPIRKKIGPNLKALICGSAPLSKETQFFFLMLGIRVLQGYGLTETAALCTLDDPHNFKPGRVGPAIPGVKMRLGEGHEILVRGPNIFAGYWNRPGATAQAFIGDWFRTGDQGEVDDKGNWAIIGRIKNLIILNSGHNVAPEPIEEQILANLPGALQCVVMGNGQSFLIALITGEVTPAEAEKALAAVNAQLPHYKRVHGFHLNQEALSIESGLLTANGKLRREAIAARFQTQFDHLYATKKASA
ncbi:MAG TPA: AMP-binding protein [Blastocatellia bacterium]|nr:AMP-binding protein [Blastocatellia bacterium]